MTHRTDRDVMLCPTCLGRDRVDCATCGSRGVVRRTAGRVEEAAEQAEHLDLTYQPGVGDD